MDNKATLNLDGKHQLNHSTVYKSAKPTRSWFPVAVALFLLLSVAGLYHVHQCFRLSSLINPQYTNSEKETITLYRDPIKDPIPHAETPVSMLQPETLIELLQNLTFLNSGVVKNSDEFVWLNQRCQYLESQNVSGPYTGWADVNSVNYLFRDRGQNYVDPPSGMRSSVPLGGISTGVFELRADGSFHEFTIFNQYPAGAAKMQTFDDMFMAVRTQANDESVALVLQTHPSNKELPGVRSLDYRGAYPVSKLLVNDPRLPVDMSVYAYSWYKHSDMNISATPAVAFTAVFRNTLTEDVNASFMLNLPIGLEHRTQRVADQFSPNLNSYDSSYASPPAEVHQLTVQPDKDMSIECFMMCGDGCKSWTYNKSSSECLVYKDAPRMNGHNDNCSSGVKTHWTVNSGCLTVNRDTPGYNTHGNMSLCAFSSDKEVDIKVGTSNSVTSLWKDFSTSGSFSEVTEGSYVAGAVSGQVSLKPNEVKEVTIVLGWYFPERDFLGLPVGNYYSHLVDNSSQAAQLVGKNVKSVVKDAAKLHTTFFGSDVDETLQDMLINSLSHIRSAFWLKDGRWRQWEAHDCVNLDSVHNDGERHIPYLMIFPDSTISKMRAWASFQLDNGMIQEQLRCGCQSLPILPIEVEFGCGRAMSDVSSMFIVYLLEILQWHPGPTSNQVVKELWPNAKRAAQWHLDVSKKVGMPQYLVSTYDVLGLRSYPYASYNGAFHLLAMKAAEKLAVWMNDTDFALECHTAFLVGQDTLDDILWNSTGKYYNAYSTTEEDFAEELFFEDLRVNLCDYPKYHKEEWGECYDGSPTNPGAIMTDTFYAQVLAYSLGIGTLVKDENKLRSHMKAERVYSHSPRGMVVMTGRYTKVPIPWSDNAIWMMGNPNWASIQLHLGEDRDEAMDVVRESFDQWRTKLNEIWNVAGILASGDYTNSGASATTDDTELPYITSHYGYYMSSWHIILALSGQNVDVNEQKMTFSPKFPLCCSSECKSYKLPVMLPTVWGTLKRDSGFDLAKEKLLYVHYTLSLEYGTVDVMELSVDDCKMQNAGVTTVDVDHPAKWYCPVTCL
ncbi:uncharacterized protein LOC135350425 [Halichondria panicea]|uniref:uncharacterized protein LOC135350425 n=1 Tax=Halichondria panicea TaxID=6063 RepID=UPI00312B438E